MDVMDEVDTISKEMDQADTKAEKAAKVIEEGTYEGTVFTWNKVEEDKKSPNSSYVGIPQYKIGVRLYDCPTLGETKTGWFSITTHKLLNDKGNPKSAYKACKGLLKAFGMLDSPLPDALEQAKVTRLRYRVGAFTSDREDPETGEKEVVNFLSAVTPL